MQTKEVSSEITVLNLPQENSSLRSILVLPEAPQVNLAVVLEART